LKSPGRTKEDRKAVVERDIVGIIREKESDPAFTLVLKTNRSMTNPNDRNEKTLEALEIFTPLILLSMILLASIVRICFSISWLISDALRKSNGESAFVFSLVMLLLLRYRTRERKKKMELMRRQMLARTISVEKIPGRLCSFI